MRLRGPLIGLAAAAAFLVAAPAVSAATEVGTDCAADAEAPPHTLVPLEKHPSSRPLTVPTAGIVTSWRADLAPPLTSASSQEFKVMRAMSGDNSFQVVAESAPETLTVGSNVFPARIPVRAGDRFGISGGEAGSVVFCSNRGAGETFGSIGSDLRTGSSATFTVGTEVQVPIVATVEADADGDGYGDETQDACPTSAAFTGACPPPVTLHLRAKARTHAILVWATPSGQATVDSYGQVGWGYKPSPKLKTAGAKPKRLIVGLSGPKKEVFPGASTKFRIGLPRLVLERLAKLTPRESLVAKLTLRATNLASVSKNTRLRVKLKGRMGA